MGFFSNILSATIKTALTPIAIIKDVVDIAKGEEADNTKNLLKSAGEDFDEAIDEISGG